jgi:thiol-disulfide isomerase/thioredoxin
MYLIRSFLILLTFNYFFPLTSSCTTKIKQPSDDKQVLDSKSGLVQNPDTPFWVSIKLEADTKSILIYYDSADIQHIIIPTTTGKKLSDIIKLKLSHPTCLFVISQLYQLPFYVDASCSITISTAKTGMKFLKNGFPSKELSFFSELEKYDYSMLGYEYNYAEKYNSISDKKIKDSILLNCYEKSIKALDSTNLTTKAKSIYRALIKSEFFKQRINRYYGNTLIRKIADNDFERIMEDFNDFFTDTTFMNEFFFRTTFQKYKFFQYNIIPKKTINYNHLLSLITSEKDNSQKDYLLYVTSGYILQNAPQNADSIIEALISTIKNNFWRTEVENRWLTQKNAHIGANNLLIPANRDKEISFENILTQYKGKILYIDFWASWCIPCRQSMKHSIPLQDSYKGKNIELVYVSIDKNKSQWLNASKMEGLDNNSNSFLIKNPAQAEILQKLKIESIPRYVIIGKNGKILNPRAKPPSVEELNRLILIN